MVVHGSLKKKHNDHCYLFELSHFTMILMILACFWCQVAGYFTMHHAPGRHAYRLNIACDGRDIVSESTILHAQLQCRTTFSFHRNPAFCCATDFKSRNSSVHTNDNQHCNGIHMLGIIEVVSFILVVCDIVKQIGANMVNIDIYYLDKGM